MGFLILLVIVVIPILEISVFIKAGEQIGLWSTISLVVITAVVGSALLRQQGLTALFNVRKNMNAGILPINELFDGMCLLLAGALLITPGFVTDGLGLMLFLPIFRSTIRNLFTKHIRDSGSNLSVYSGFEQQPDRNQRPNIIDGEFHEIKTDHDNENSNINNKNPRSPPEP